MISLKEVFRVIVSEESAIGFYKDHGIYCALNQSELDHMWSLFITAPGRPEFYPKALSIEFYFYIELGDDENAFGVSLALPGAVINKLHM